MTIEIEGTMQDLYRLRQARRTAGDAINAMGRAGLDVEALESTLVDLNETVVYVQVPCILCKRRYPMPAEVSGEELPYAVLCEECDAKTTAAVLAMNEGAPKRKRRTKAEMEAARAAETP